VTRGSILLERFVNYELKLSGKSRVQFAHRLGDLFKDGILEHRPGVTREWTLTGGHLIQHRAKGKQIRSRVQFLAAYLLWRHVPRRPHGHAGEADGKIGGCQRYGLLGGCRRTDDIIAVEEN